jgi:regulation of enolase protein 1 (concanavalin A-like superfamily)
MIKLKPIITLISLLTTIACSSTTTTEPTNKPNTTTNQPTNARQTPSATNTNQPQNGEKIEKIVQVVFNGESLPDDWRWIDPDKGNPSSYTLKDGNLIVKVPAGKDLFGDNYDAPRLIKTVSGDFEIETGVKFSPKQSYQGAGLLIWAGKTQYLRLERGFGGVDGGEGGIRFDKRENDGYEAVSGTSNTPTEIPEVELKIRRNGKEFAAFWREPNKDWKEIGKTRLDYPNNLDVGLIICNTAEEITAEFSNLKLALPTK